MIYIVKERYLKKHIPYVIFNTMGEKELGTKEPTLCIFDNIQIINSLSEGKIPQDLKNRCEYTLSSDNGTSTEIYTDIETGDELLKTEKLFKDLGFFKECVVIKTGVGRYEMSHYYREFGCTAEEYFFNDIKTDKETFLDILKKQEKLSE